jgi:Tfp pilus assembly protein PilF
MTPDGADMTEEKEIRSDVAELYGAQGAKDVPVQSQGVPGYVTECPVAHASDPEESSDTKRSGWPPGLLNKAADGLSLCARLIGNAALIALIVSLILMGYRELKTDYVVIEPFEVPKQLEQQGYTGRAVANILLDQMRFIKNAAKTKMKGKMYIPLWTQPRLEIQVPVAGVSFTAAVQYVRAFYGRAPIRISGNIILIGKVLYVTTRISDGLAETISGTSEDLNGLLFRSAQLVYRHVQPYILATYLADNDKDACVDTIRYILSHPLDGDAPWAYNLWGNILSDQGDYAGAVAKYEKSLEKANKLNHKFPAPYNGWGLTLAKQGKYEEAAAKFQRATELDPKFAEAYSNWGLSLMRLGHYERAADRLRKATELDPNLAEAYLNWGIVLWRQGDHGGAMSKAERAFELDPHGQTGQRAKGLIGEIGAVK